MRSRLGPPPAHTGELLTSMDCTASPAHDTNFCNCYQQHLCKTSTNPMGAVPAQIQVVYDPADVDHFIALADAIEDAHPDLMVEGTELEAGGGRSGTTFEVKSAEGHFLFSGRQQGRLPGAEELLSIIAAVGENSSS